MIIHGRAASLLYKRLGRTPPAPGTVKDRPPSGRLLTAQYSQRLTRIVHAWYDHVETIGRQELGSRLDATFQEQLEEAFDKLLQASGLDAFLARKAKMIINKQSAYVQKITRLPPAQLSPQQLIEDYRRANAQLITGMKDDQVNRVVDILRRAQSEGQRWEQAAPAIKSALNVGTDRARLIARDQTLKFNSSMAQLTQTQSGIEEYTWSTTKQASVRGYPGGPNTRKNGPNHYVLEGTVHRWDTPPLIPNTTNHFHPGQDINCECLAIPRISYFE